MKPIPGLIDAPLLWQAALAIFLCNDMGGRKSLLDDNYFYWPNEVANVSPLVWLSYTVHVDDLLSAGTIPWLVWGAEKLEIKFGKVSRNPLPFTHVGLEHERLSNGTIYVHQYPYLEGIEKITMSKTRAAQKNDDCTPSEKHEYRSLLQQVMWLTMTRLDAVGECTWLQQAAQQPQIQHITSLNSC